MKAKSRMGMILTGCLILFASAVSAQAAPQLINYQGRLTNSAGMPLDGTTVDIAFKFYSAATGGTLYLTILQQDVVVTGGLYNVLIGSGTVTPGTEISMANVFRNHSEVWLGVAVDADAEMTPRSRISSVPYALNCTGVTLSEIESFLHTRDFDGDGHDKTSYSGDDCNDSEARVYAGAPEVCDGIDNQCPGDAGYGQVDEGCGSCEDLDGDGRGWGCAAGPDCDDLDPNNWLSCATCSDLDGDGSFEGCDAYAAPLAGPDCDDLDLNNWTSCATCEDTDADNWFAGCDDYVTIDGPDCDDLDPNNWLSCATCSDLDGDGSFEGCDAYAAPLAGPDCDDLDLNNWASCATCEDTDADNWFAGCDAYVTIGGPDCDDLDANNWLSCAACLDGDTDTYYAGCDDYFSILGPDCDDEDDATYPGAPETCRDGLDNQCPGDPGYGTVDEGCPMAFIPAGCFNMGDSIDGCIYASNECPVHNVCITSNFYMDVHETTNAEYAACVSGGGCTAPSNSSSNTRSSYYGNPTYDNFPVTWVNWNQATAYCTWAGKRLPTEAEWEYAARGGSETRFPWGDTISCANANYRANPSSFSYDTNPTDGYCMGDDTSEVESYAPNGYGLYDVVGNLYEWVNDWYSSSYYSSSPTNDPPGPVSGTYRAQRGGPAYYGTAGYRISSRVYDYQTWPNRDRGIRCAGD